ncbi:SigB/SigF/SigG family RNA polymerase sigma factor [Actinoplanes awajinensis]|uniref:RNA polymerase subunit sigma n=1 Tax=Actinoplanes awajinensis subsp. mycoplanecinus TaxID=135947 RepID=A0A117MKI3_9ACTN|nr:SigB/SigF/SigG family RNA polymerase sigma factor [Actinoplanes awajinensis]KUL22452.1 RNA polymerase subunit sigma [Actinoplanes awajinensis subsp. mycoplanecinus]
MRSSASVVDIDETDDPASIDLVSALAAMPVGPARTSARQEAIAAWLPMARRLARRYASRGEDLDDLTQVATVGLIKAVDGFAPDRGTDFAGYAIPTILGELKRHFRDRMWNIRVPRRLQELNMAINKARGRLVQTLGRTPTVADIAQHLGIGEEEVIEGLEGAHAYRPASLSTPISTDGDATLGDTLGTAEPGYRETELHLSLGAAMTCLDEREQQIVALRFFGHLTQSEIGAKIGVSQMHVSRLLTQALAKLRVRLSN